MSAKLVRLCSIVRGNGTHFFWEMSFPKITLQLHDHISLESTSPTLDCTHSFEIQTITWKICLGIILLENQIFSYIK